MPKKKTFKKLATRYILLPAAVGFILAFVIDFFINWFFIGKFWIFQSESFFKYEIGLIVFLGIMLTYFVSKTLLEYE